MIKHQDKDFLPLFPLPMVIGPGETVALHIFEPRYRQMMKDIRATSAPKHVLPFGLSMFREKPGKIADFGCTIRIEQVVKSHADGRMDIIGRGEHRYTLESVDRELPYARAHISYIVDSDPEVDLTLLAEATRAVERLRREVLDRTEAAPHHQGFPISFQLAHDAGLDVEAKYHLLCLRSENDRLRVVRDQSRKALQLLRKARAIRERVQRNGHFQEFPKIDF